jgi:hypothetical protein
MPNDFLPPTMLLRLRIDPTVPPGNWRHVDGTWLVHCVGCAEEVRERFSRDPAPSAPVPEPPPARDLFRRRPDGWPFCPSCGEDELYSLFLPLTPEDHKPENYFNDELRCYRCEWVRIPPGAAMPPKGEGEG